MSDPDDIDYDNPSGAYVLTVNGLLALITTASLVCIAVYIAVNHWRDDFMEQLTDTIEVWVEAAIVGALNLTRDTYNAITNYFQPDEAPDDPPSQPEEISGKPISRLDFESRDDLDEYLNQQVSQTQAVQDENQEQANSLLQQVKSSTNLLPEEATQHESSLDFDLTRNKSSSAGKDELPADSRPESTGEASATNHKHTADTLSIPSVPKELVKENTETPQDQQPTTTTKFRSTKLEPLKTHKNIERAIFGTEPQTKPAATKPSQAGPDGQEETPLVQSAPTRYPSSGSRDLQDSVLFGAGASLESTNTKNPPVQKLGSQAKAARAPFSPIPTNSVRFQFNGEAVLNNRGPINTVVAPRRPETKSTSTVGPRKFDTNKSEKTSVEDSTPALSSNSVTNATQTSQPPIPTGSAANAKNLKEDGKYNKTTHPRDDVAGPSTTSDQASPAGSSSEAAKYPDSVVTARGPKISSTTSKQGSSVAPLTEDVRFSNAMAGAVEFNQQYTNSVERPVADSAIQRRPLPVQHAQRIPGKENAVPQSSEQTNAKADALPTPLNAPQINESLVKTTTKIVRPRAPWPSPLAQVDTVGTKAPAQQDVISTNKPSHPPAIGGSNATIDIAEKDAKHAALRKAQDQLKHKNMSLLARFNDLFPRGEVYFSESTEARPDLKGKGKGRSRQHPSVSEGSLEDEENLQGEHYEPSEFIRPVEDSDDSDSGCSDDFFFPRRVRKYSMPNLSGRPNFDDDFYPEIGNPERGDVSGGNTGVDKTDDGALFDAAADELGYTEVEYTDGSALSDASAEDIDFDEDEETHWQHYTEGTSSRNFSSSHASTSASKTLPPPINQTFGARRNAYPDLYEAALQGLKTAEERRKAKKHVTRLLVKMERGLIEPGDVVAELGIRPQNHLHDDEEIDGDDDAEDLPQQIPTEEEEEDLDMAIGNDEQQQQQQQQAGGKKKRRRPKKGKKHRVKAANNATLGNEPTPSNHDIPPF